MTKDLICVSSDCLISEGIKLLKTHNIGCLLIKQKSRLIGLVTETDFEALGL